MFKVNNKETSERYHWLPSDMFIVNFEYISQLVLMPAGYVLHLTLLEVHQEQDTGQILT